VTTTKRTGGKGRTSAGKETRSKPKQAARKPARPTGRLPVRGDLKNARKPARRVAAEKVRPLPTAAVQSTILNNGRDLSDLRELALELLNGALDKKALMPVLIDVSAMASYTDFIGIVSGRSDRQVDAIADHITAMMKARGRYILGHEGGGNGRWTLLDFGSIVIHVFYHPVREFYDLESLWIDAPRVKMAIPPEAMITQPDALYGAL
jgi:ribosome-associated protein